MDNFEADQRAERERRGMDSWSTTEEKYTGTFPVPSQPKSVSVEAQIMNAEQRMKIKLDENTRRWVSNVDRIDTAMVDARVKTDILASKNSTQETALNRHEEQISRQAESLSDIREGLDIIRQQMEELRRVNEALRHEKDTLEQENENLREQNFEYIEENEELQGDIGTMTDMLKETRNKLDETTQKLRDATHTGDGLRKQQSDAYEEWMKKLGLPVSRPPATTPIAGRIMYTTNRTNSSTPTPTTAPDDPVAVRREAKAQMFASIYGANPFRNRGTSR